MDALKKPPLKKPHVYIKCSVCVVLILVYLLLMFLAFYNAYRYTVAEPLELEAEIVRVEYVSTESADSYDAIMRYAYNGITYEATYKSFAKERDAQAMVGKKVTAIVDSNEPKDTLEHIRSVATTLLLCAGGVMLFLVFAPYVQHRQTYVQTYGWCTETILKDIPALPKYSTYRLLIWVVGCFAMYLCYPSVFSGGIASCLVELMLVIYSIMGTIGLMQYIRDCLLAKAGKISFRCDTFINKYVRADSESGDRYYVNFKNGTTIWQKSVSSVVYEKMKEGDVVESACLGNQKKPILSFYHNEDVF